MVGSPRRTTGGGRGCRPRAPPPSVSPPSPVAPLTVLRATASTLPHRSARRRTRLACDSTTNRFLPPPDRNPRSSLYLALPLPSLPPPPLVQSRRRNPRIRASLIHTIARPQASTFLRLIGLSEAIVVEPSSRRGDTGASFSAGMVPRDTVNAAVGRSLVQGSVMNQKCDKKVPKKIHKSEREKRKRGTQNDLFNELGAMLEPDRQNNGKACVLGETTRILKGLVLQVESLRKENITLKNESHYVVLERNELRDDNSMLRSEILELQDKLRTRQQSNPIWSQGSTRSALTVSYPTSRVLPVQHSPHLPDITTTRLSLQPVVPEQCYAAPPRELQLFPEASSASTEDSELSQEQGISNSVTRPQARYPAPAVMSSLVNTFPILPRTGEEQQYSSGTSEEQGLHRF